MGIRILAQVMRHGLLAGKHTANIKLRRVCQLRQPIAGDKICYADVPRKFGCAYSRGLRDTFGSAAGSPDLMATPDNSSNAGTSCGGGSGRVKAVERYVFPEDD